MEPPDPSWYLGSYDHTIQQAYQVLRQPPLNLEELAPPPFTQAIQGRIYHLLHEALCEFPDQFPELVGAIIPPARPTPSQGLTRISPSVSICLNLLQAELAQMREEREAEEQAIFVAALDAGYSDESHLKAGPKSEPDPAGDWNHVEMEEDDAEDEEEVEEVEEIEEVEQVGTSYTRTRAWTRESTPTPRASITLKSPAKRVSGQSVPDPVKRFRTTPIAHQPFRPPGVGVSTAPRTFDRTTSNVSTSSTSTFSRTNSSSTTTSVATTALTTPAGSIFAPSRNNSNDTTEFKSEQRWKPKGALKADERRVLCTPLNPWQAQLQRYGVRFEVQWEMDRLLARHPDLTWDDIEPKNLSAMVGSAADVIPRLGQLLAAVEARGMAVDEETPVLLTDRRRVKLYGEMDGEEEILRSEDFGSLDGTLTCNGRIAYSIIVRPSKPRDMDKLLLGDMEPPKDIPPSQAAPKDWRSNLLPFKMTLCEPDMPGKSFRLARRFGSRRIISFKLRDFAWGNTKDAMSLFVGRILDVLGRPYRAFWAPPDRDSVFAVEMSDPGPRYLLHSVMPTFAEFLSIYNDPLQKPAQPMAKWAARPQILFSDSNPGTMVHPSSIAQIRDIVSRKATSYNEASTEQILTDGCGLMSDNLARQLRVDLSLPRPCVVQVRLGGSKGLLTVMNDAQELQYAGKLVVLRDSMVKALSAQGFAHDRSLLTVDVLRYGYLRIGTTLSSETIIGMRHGGVTAETFLNMAKKGLEELKNALLPTPLLGEKKEDVACRLVSSCYRYGGVGGERRKRAATQDGLSTRTMGLADRISEDDDAKDEGGGLIHESEQYGVDPVSGQPGSIAEALMMALMAGFDPLESHYTGAKLHHLFSTLSDSMIRNFRIPIERSISAFIVPDSLQILRPDEVFVSFSTNCPIDPDTGSPITHLLGAVLALRSPCKLPTDIRKFTAVYKPELAHLQDCIVMSANALLCARSPASFLGGGDYDGDTAQIFWEPELIAQFLNADETFAEIPVDFVEKNFKRNVVKVEEFHAALEAEGADKEMIIANQQHFLLGALQDDKSTGNYSDLHGNAVYRLGYDHPETIRLAHMFCHVLDARKSGLRVRPEVKQQDERTYGGSLQWREWRKGATASDAIAVKRNWKRHGSFILDQLRDAGEAHRGVMLRHFPAEMATPSPADHLELSALWSRVKDRPHVSGQVDLVLQHVAACHEVWTSIRSGRLPSGSIYDMYYLIKSGDRARLSPAKRSGLITPSKNRRKAGDINELARLTLMRQLAQIWRDELTVTHVPDLCLYGDQITLRRIKISCGATMQKYKPKQTFVFDMDFATTCAIKSAARGEVMSVVDNVARCLKPGWQK